MILAVLFLAASLAFSIVAAFFIARWLHGCDEKKDQ